MLKEHPADFCNLLPILRIFSIVNSQAVADLGVKWIIIFGIFLHSGVILFSVYSQASVLVPLLSLDPVPSLE